MLDHLFKQKKKYEGTFFITGMNTNTGEYEIGLLHNNNTLAMGKFSKGLKKDETFAINKILEKYKSGSKGDLIFVHPGICIHLTFDGIINGKLIHPKFHSFQFKLDYEECTIGQLILVNSSMKEDVELTSASKALWNTPFLNKEFFITYLFEISSYMLPFLKNRLLTVIRFPHGVDGESFYQKSCPTYAPSFIKTMIEDDTNFILCNELSTLIWLGNQLAMEYHIPFETIHKKKPIEIVFDLDPPSKKAFSLAVSAAQEMKKLFDKFQIVSFPKLSGNKGLQIHIPIMNQSFTYENTRVFTEFIAKYLVEKFPEKYTIERMKKKRGNRLYIDYLQHWEGKTIISPYSPRGKEKPTVAAPLYWKEVNKGLDPDDFTIFTMIDRVNDVGCPFLDYDYFKTKNTSIKDIITTIKKEKSMSP